MRVIRCRVKTPSKAVETTTGRTGSAGCRSQFLPLLGLEHVKNKEFVFHSQMLLPNRAPVVKKSAQSRPMRSINAEFLVTPRMVELCPGKGVNEGRCQWSG